MYRWAKFHDEMIEDSKNIFNYMFTTLCTNTHHYVTFFKFSNMIQNVKN